ncbi:MAG: hypothetical protein M3353_08820 [Actinomycetota bacterium]|nr:hypothetical protein [Actinomycetota bacterium]
MVSRRGFLGLTAAAVAGAAGVRAAQTWTPDLPVVLSAARPADGVCEAYAVNTKLFYANRVYGYTDGVVDLLTELGVRTVRERVTTGSSPGALAQLAAMPRLAERGIRWHPTVGLLEDWPEAAAATAAALGQLTGPYARAVGGDLGALLHSLGGCNEVDGQDDPQWPAHARLMQTELWRQARSQPLLADVPVAGPSTRTDVTVARAEALGDLSGVSDWGNAHLYLHGRSATPQIDPHLAILERCFPRAERWFFTESGYNNAPNDDAGSTVREQAAATYSVRAICDFFVRDSIYGRFELLDDPDRIDFTNQSTVNATAERQAHFGLVAVPADAVSAATPETWRRKPEFYATRRLLRLMSDPGPVFRPDPFGIVMHGSAYVQQALVQKRDGRHYLLLWRDVDVATPYPDAARLPITPTTVTVHLQTARPVAVYHPVLRGDPVHTQPPSTRLTVDLDGDLRVAEIG